jgi:hypothetical protein
MHEDVKQMLRMQAAYRLSHPPELPEDLRYLFTPESLAEADALIAKSKKEENCG